MKKFSTKSLSLLLVGSLIALNAGAQEAPPDNALRIATGPRTGVYTQMARDVQRVCGQVVPLAPVESKGGLDNLMLLSSNQADIGFAQVDLMQQMGRNGDQNIQELQAIASLHSNLLHVLSKADGTRVGSIAGIPYTGTVKVINRFSDLKGMRVALVGSAHVLGQTLERQLGYGMQFVEAESDENAMSLLLTNQVQAILTTGGWPYPPVANLRPQSGIKLAEYDLAPSAPFILVKRNYPGAGAYNMSFLGSTNLLLSRPFKPNGERGRMVAALQKCILQHLDELQEGQYHAAWRDVKSPTDTLGVPAIGKSDAQLPARAKVAGRS